MKNPSNRRGRLEHSEKLDKLFIPKTEITLNEFFVDSQVLLCSPSGENLFKPDTHRFTVRLKPFQAGNPHDVGSQPVKPLLGEVDDG